MTIAEQVKTLGLPVGSFAVFGSGPMIVRGMRESGDIDIIVTEVLFKEIEKDPTWVAHEMRDHHPGLKRGMFEIFYTWAPGAWDVEQLIREAELFDGVPFVRLESVIEWKQLRDSDKDREDLGLIEAFKKAATH